MTHPTPPNTELAEAIQTALKNPSDAGGEPIGYIIGTYLDTPYYEKYGIGLSKHKSGMATTPVYAQPQAGDLTVTYRGQNIDELPRDILLEALRKALQTIKDREESYDRMMRLLETNGKK